MFTIITIGVLVIIGLIAVLVVGVACGMLMGIYIAIDDITSDPFTRYTLLTKINDKVGDARKDLDDIVENATEDIVEDWF